MGDVHPTYNAKVDMWAIGCVLHELVFKLKRFNSDWELLKYVMAVEGGNPPTVIEVKSEMVPDERKRLFIGQKITELLSIDPGRRPSAKLLYEKFTAWGNDVQGAKEGDPNVMHQEPPSIEFEPLSMEKQISSVSVPASAMQRNKVSWNETLTRPLRHTLAGDGIEITPTTSNDIVSHVEASEGNASFCVEVIDIETFRHHQGFDLALFATDENGTAPGVQRFTAVKYMTLASLYIKVCERYGVSANGIRLWELVRRQNNTLRPHRPISPLPKCT